MILLGEAGAKRTMQQAREVLAAELDARYDLLDGTYWYRRDGMLRKLHLRQEEGVWRILLEVVDGQQEVAA